MPISVKENLDAQKLLKAYMDPAAASGRYWEPLSRAVKDLVHRSVGKREIGDLEDFEEDCVVAIWTKISALRADPSAGGIDNLEAFVRQAVHNRYCDAIRRKRPKWYNLKLELLEIFSGKANIEGFALWQAADSSGRVCGFAAWKGSSKTASAKCRELIDNAAAYSPQALEKPRSSGAADLRTGGRGPRLLWRPGRNRRAHQLPGGVQAGSQRRAAVAGCPGRR